MTEVLTLAFLDARHDNYKIRTKALEWLMNECDEDIEDAFSFRYLVDNLDLDIGAVNEKIDELYDQHQARPGQIASEPSPDDSD